MAKELRWAVLGTGVIANEMAQALEQMGKSLYAVGNRTHEKAVAFAEKYHVTKVYDDFLAYIEEKRWKPFLLTKSEDSAVFDFTFLPVTQYEGLMNVTQYESFSSLLAAFFEKKGRVERMTRRSSDLHKAVVNARDRP